MEESSEAGVIQPHAHADDAEAWCGGVALVAAEPAETVVGPFRVSGVDGVGNAELIGEGCLGDGAVRCHGGDDPEPDG